MRQRFYRFMQGRYGVDQYSRFLLMGTSAFLLISLFSNVSLFYWAGLLLLAYSYFRIFSRNYTKRAEENRKYLHATTGIRSRFAKFKYMLGQRKQYHIYTCPDCRQKIRIPRGHGKVEVRCPKCSTTFIKRS